MSVRAAELAAMVVASAEDAGEIVFAGSLGRVTATMRRALAGELDDVGCFNQPGDPPISVYLAGEYDEHAGFMDALIDLYRVTEPSE